MLNILPQIFVIKLALSGKLCYLIFVMVEILGEIKICT